MPLILATVTKTCRWGRIQTLVFSQTRMTKIKVPHFCEGPADGYLPKMAYIRCLFLPLLIRMLIPSTLLSIHLLYFGDPISDQDCLQEHRQGSVQRDMSTFLVAASLNKIFLYQTSTSYKLPGKSGSPFLLTYRVFVGLVLERS